MSAIPRGSGGNPTSFTTGSAHEVAPLSPMGRTRQFFKRMEHANVLRFALGVAAHGAPDIAQNTIVNVLDCESFERDHKLLTEFGLVSFDRRDMVEAFKEPGPHGENMLKCMYYYHFRMISNVVYVNKWNNPSNPENNWFGNTKFVTHSEAREILRSAFFWPIDATKPELGNCPVIFMGHAPSNDFLTLKASLGFDIEALDTVVASIDTQHIARDVDIRGRGYQISLKTLCSNFKMPSKDFHTAGNDAAYTAIVGVQMVLRPWWPKTKKTMLAVIAEVQNNSLAEISMWGLSNFCSRCGVVGHRRPKCRRKLHCPFCKNFGRTHMITTHTGEMCPRLEV